MTPNDGHQAGHQPPLVDGSRKTPRKVKVRRGPYQWTGIHTIKREMKALDEGEVGAALREWRAALVADLGGEDAISMQQKTLVDLACRSKLLVDSVDAASDYGSLDRAQIAAMMDAAVTRAAV